MVRLAARVGVARAEFWTLHGPRELRSRIDAWHAQARAAAWYSELASRQKRLPPLDVWLQDRPAEPTREEWDKMRADHEALVRRAAGR